MSTRISEEGTMPFSAMYAALFSDPAMGKDAKYIPASGDAVMLRVIQRQSSTEIGPYSVSVLSETNVFEVLVADIPDLREGGKLVVEGIVYQLNGTPRRDPTGLVWVVEAPEVGV
jgi:hypothetical protein